MNAVKACRWRIFRTAGIVLSGVIWLTGMSSAQEEVTSPLHRYKAYEASTGYYEQYEVRPQRQRPLINVPGLRQGGLFPYSPSAAQVRIRTRLSDSHRGIKFYTPRRCEECHLEQAQDNHTVRANLTCRQCHGGEPIASIDHYYSPLNPIRRHAYVCSKCHQGASAAYASYIIHEPPAGSPAARENFPTLYYAYWLMISLFVGTLAFFIPHSFMVGLRELLKRKRGKS